LQIHRDAPISIVGELLKRRAVSSAPLWTISPLESTKPPQLDSRARVYIYENGLLRKKAEAVQRGCSGLQVPNITYREDDAGT